MTVNQAALDQMSSMPLADAPTAEGGGFEAALARAGDVMRAALRDGAFDDAQVADWLRDRTLRILLGAYEPFQTILRTLEWVEAHDADGIDYRSALAHSLARIIDSKPEAGRRPGAMVFNIYHLAVRLNRPAELHTALAAAVKRGMPDTRDIYAPLGRYLFDAAVVNQTDAEALKWFWMALLEDPKAHRRAKDDPGAEPWRRTNWSVDWQDAWDGLVSMPRRLIWGDIGPSIASLRSAFPLVAANIERDVPLAGDGDAGETTLGLVKRRMLFSQALDRVCGRWPGVIDRRDVEAAVRRARCPDWCEAVLDPFPEEVWQRLIQYDSNHSLDYLVSQAHGLSNLAGFESIFLTKNFA